MTARPSTFVSVKYRRDNLLERSISAFMRKAGCDVTMHQGTVDFLKRAAASPVAFESAGLKLLTSSSVERAQAGRQIEPTVLSPALIRNLVQDICGRQLVILIWSKPYSESLWCSLERKAAILANKPLIVIWSDSCELHQELAARGCPVIDVNHNYRTSEVMAKVDQLQTTATNQPAEALAEQLEEWVESYNPRPPVSLRPESHISQYERLVTQLWRADARGMLHEEVRVLAQEGQINDEFRVYLEEAGAGYIAAPMEPWYYPYLLGEILDIRFLNPPMSPKLRSYYETRIVEALAEAKHTAIRVLIDDLVRQSLFSREFVEYFGHHLDLKREALGPLAAGAFWEICTEQIAEAV